MKHWSLADVKRLEDAGRVRGVPALANPLVPTAEVKQGATRRRGPNRWEARYHAERIEPEIVAGRIAPSLTHTYVFTPRSSPDTATIGADRLGRPTRLDPWVMACGATILKDSHIESGFRVFGVTRLRDTWRGPARVSVTCRACRVEVAQMLASAARERAPGALEDIEARLAAHESRIAGLIATDRAAGVFGPGPSDPRDDYAPKWRPARKPKTKRCAICRCKLRRREPGAPGRPETICRD